MLQNKSINDWMKEVRNYEIIRGEEFKWE